MQSDHIIVGTTLIEENYPKILCFDTTAVSFKEYKTPTGGRGLLGVTVNGWYTKMGIGAKDRCCEIAEDYCEEISNRLMSGCGIVFGTAYPYLDIHGWRVAELAQTRMDQIE